VEVIQEDLPLTSMDLKPESFIKVIIKLFYALMSIKKTLSNPFVVEKSKTSIFILDHLSSMKNL
jgi:hypothetical protein